MFLTDVTNKVEIIKYIGIAILIYTFVMTTLFFLLLFHVVDIHTIVESLQKCVM